MRIGDILYFAPGLKYTEVDLDGPQLPEQFGRRVTGFYIDPAYECANSGHAFASGVLLVSCIDALARIRFAGKVGYRFRKFASEELSSFSGSDVVERFYDEFRNGLVHECRLKNGAQFSLEVENTVQALDDILVVNPKFLADEVLTALDSYVALIQSDKTAWTRLATVLERDLSKDFNVAKAKRAAE